MGDSSLIRTTLLIALLAAMGFVAAGRAPAAESPTAEFMWHPQAASFDAQKTWMPAP
jgi:hypothetical protein